MHINAIHPSSPNSSEEDAATRIQASFRGYRVRKTLRVTRPNSQKRDEHGENATGVNLEEKSATKIQAGIRGFLVRKKQKLASEAATKIQASFRGFKTRKDLKGNPKDTKTSSK